MLHPRHRWLTRLSYRRTHLGPWGPSQAPSPSSCQACGCGFPGRADPVPPAPPGCTRARVHQTPGFLPLRQRGRALAVGGATTGMWSTGRAKKPSPMSCWYCLVLFCRVNRLYKTSNISIMFHHASIFFPHLGEPNTTFWVVESCWEVLLSKVISGAWQVSEASGDWGQPRTIWFAPGQVNSTCDLERTIEDWGLKQNRWDFSTAIAQENSWACWVGYVMVCHLFFSMMLCNFEIWVSAWEEFVVGLLMILMFSARSKVSGFMAARGCWMSPASAVPPRGCWPDMKGWEQRWRVQQASAWRCWVGLGRVSVCQFSIIPQNGIWWLLAKHRY